MHREVMQITQTEIRTKTFLLHNNCAIVQPLSSLDVFKKILVSKFLTFQLVNQADLTLT